MPRAARTGSDAGAPAPDPGVLPRFRDLEGIGPTLEAKLHATGLTSWGALADVLAALARVRDVSPGTLRTLAAKARTLDDADDGDDRGDGHAVRRESFLIRLTVEGDGRVDRTHVVHVNGGVEEQWAGWSHDALVRFLRATAELADAPAEALAPVIALAGGGTAPAAPSAAPSSAAPAAPRHVTVPLGRVLGGTPQDLEVVVPAAQLSGLGRAAYRARLVSRPLGSAGDRWTPATDEIQGVAGDGELRARFPGVAVPRGVHNVQAVVDLEPSTR